MHYFGYICPISPQLWASATLTVALKNKNKLSYKQQLISLLAGRTGSTFMKVLITAERYIFIACPDASGMWMSTMKTRLVALAVLLFSVFINLPRYLSVDVIPIDVPITKIPRLRKLNLNSIMITSEVSRKHWFEVLYKTAFYIDLWGPFPLLILFSIMTYYEVFFPKNTQNSLSSALFN